MIYRWKLCTPTHVSSFPFLQIQLLTGWEEHSSVGTDLFFIYIRRVCMHPYVCVPGSGYSQLRLGFGDSPGILISWGSSHATQWVQRNTPSSEGVGEQPGVGPGGSCDVEGLSVPLGGCAQEQVVSQSSSPPQLGWELLPCAPFTAKRAQTSEFHNSRKCL